MRLSLAETNVESVDGSVKVSGLRADVPIRVTAERGEASVTAPRSWEVGLGSLRVKVGDETLGVGGATLWLSGQDGQPLASVAYGAGDLGFRIGALAGTTDPVSVAMGDGAKATLATIQARAAASRDPEGTSVSAELVVDGIEATVERALSDAVATVMTRDSRLRVAVTGRGVVDELAELPLTVDVELKAGQSRAALAGAFGKADARVASASLTGWAELEEGRRPTVEAKVAFDGGSARWSEWRLLVAGVSAEIPVLLNSGKRPEGKFAVEAVRLGRSRLPGLSGSLAVADWRADFAAKWPLLKQAVLQAKGHVDVSSGVPLGKARAWMPRFVIEDEKELAGILAEAQGIDLSGTLEIDAAVELLADRILPRITLKAEDVMLASKRYKAKVEGLTTEVVIDSFAPLSTPGHQRIAAARANLGGLRVEDGFVDFRIESLQSVFIERSEWGWAGGRLYTYALRFDPAKPIDLVAYGDKLDLAEILAMIPDERAEGKGTLYGRLPVSVQWGERPKVRFGNGFLYATPGEGGSVRVKDAAFLASSLESGAAQSAGTTVVAEVRKRFEAALRDFEYDVFKIDFVREGEHLVARVFVRGRGPEMVVALRQPTLLGRLGGRKPEPIKLRQEFAGVTFNIPYFDEILSEAIIERQDFTPAALGGVAR